jgi:hypothetical protein
MRHFAEVLLYAMPRCEQAVSCGEARDLICFAPLDVKHEPLICFQRDRGANAGCAADDASRLLPCLLDAWEGLRLQQVFVLVILFYPGLPAISSIGLLLRLFRRRTTMRLKLIDCPRCPALRLRSMVYLWPSTTSGT